MIDYKEIDEAMNPIIERIREMNEAIVEAFNKASGLAAIQHGPRIAGIVIVSRSNGGSEHD